MTGAVSTNSFRPRPASLDPLRQRPEAPFERLVVIPAAGIDRDDAMGRSGRLAERIGGGRIVDPEHNDGSRLGPQDLRVAATLGGGGKPAHIAVLAAGDKFLEIGARRGR